jgi:hypothetical protein
MKIETNAYNNSSRPEYTYRRKPNRSLSGLARKLSEESHGFKCAQCHNFVSAEAFTSGVQNRNHCPYCLWSRHIDLYKAGDRLAACKGQMEPVGLTLKQTLKKYARPASGELMLIHYCIECGKVSINRIAADDVPETLFEVFQASCEMDDRAYASFIGNNIQALTASDTDLVRLRLFGSSDLQNTPWQDFLKDEPLLEVLDIA